MIDSACIVTAPSLPTDDFWKMFATVNLILLGIFLPFYGEGAVDIGMMGCWLGGKCTYRPKNILQLQACGTAGRLGDLDLRNYFLCQEEDQSTCETTKTEDGHKCVWVSPPSGFKYDGSCLPSRVAGTFTALAREGIKVFLEQLDQLGLKEIPSPREQVDCLKNSYDDAACLAASDRKKRRCGWCSGIDPAYYPFVRRTSNLCIQQEYIDMGACDLLKAKMELCWDYSFLPRMDDPQSDSLQHSNFFFFNFNSANHSLQLLMTVFLWSFHRCYLLPL